MGRLNIHHERVQQLVHEKIIPIFLATNSIAGLVKALNDALRAAGAAGILHPNRLHTLLSDDSSRSLNEATIELLEQASSLIFEEDKALGERSEKILQALQSEAARLKLYSDATTEELATRLNVPVAVANRLLRRNIATSNEMAYLGNISIAEAAGPSPQAPDWSYQDTAVLRCIEAFGRHPNGRIGLVLPTGAGKTRTALRIVLSMLSKSVDAEAPAYWVSHRRNLREQAHRELQKLISANHDRVPTERLLELANRIKFVMVGDLTSLLDGLAAKPALVVVDEAHHAAAPSYQPVFINPWSAPVLLLTATPNRGDHLPIGIDEIAFTITYRELAEKRAVLTPTFLDFPVDNFDWSGAAVADLADYVIDRSNTEFTKTLVLAPRVDRVEEFYQALVERLPIDHPLKIEDIGFVHGTANSLAIENEDFLARFASKPRAILISAQLLLEGFDDPSINTVILTYPSTSVIRLMQAAGRCVRYATGKRQAYVVQARNDQIAYHFDQRWLYQEIDDFLRPQLQDIEYGSITELRERVQQVLRIHNVNTTTQTRILDQLMNFKPGEPCRLFLYGLPFYGEEEDFLSQAHWGALLESSESSVMIRTIFNSFCATGADLSDPSDFLIREGGAHGVVKDLSAGSRWREMISLLTAAYFAKREVHGPVAIDIPGSRPYRINGATTWLKYVTLRFRPAIPSLLTEFLLDCHNAAQVETQYLEDLPHNISVVKIPLPLGGAEAFLLDEKSYEVLDSAIIKLRALLADARPQDQFGVLAGFIASSPHLMLSNRLLTRIEFLLAPEDRAARILHLNDQINYEMKGGDHA